MLYLTVVSDNSGPCFTTEASFHPIICRPLSPREMFTSVRRGRVKLSFHTDTTRHGVEEGKIERVPLSVYNGSKINKFLHVPRHGVHCMSSCRHDRFVFVLHGNDWLHGSSWRGRRIYSVQEVQEFVYYTLCGIFSYGICQIRSA